MTNRLIRALALCVLLAGTAAVRAGACPVCYGAPDSPSTQGMTAAVFSLLGVTGGVLAAFATMFFRIRRRIRAMVPDAPRTPSMHISTAKESDSHA
jgi:hypothetical protein